MREQKNFGKITTEKRRITFADEKSVEMSP